MHWLPETDPKSQVVACAGDAAPSNSAATKEIASESATGMRRRCAAARSLPVMLVDDDLLLRESADVALPYCNM